MILRFLRRSKRKEPLAGRADLVAFLDSRSAFIAQKCIYEYCRARSGLLSRHLMSEQDFLAAYEVSRWEGYVAALSDLILLIEARLRPPDPRDQARLADHLQRVMVEVLRRHPLPAHRHTGWGSEVEALRERLAQAQLVPPQPAATIAKVGGTRIYEALPLHRDMTKHDRELVTNAVRFNLSRIAADLDEQLDAAALGEALLGPHPVATGSPG